jgi:hypothetical protein
VLLQHRLTLLPQTLVAPLQRYLITVQALHEEDMADGDGDVSLPYAFARTYPNAGQARVWYYVFPAAKRVHDPRSGAEQRHHVAHSHRRPLARHARTVWLLAYHRPPHHQQTSGPDEVAEEMGAVCTRVANVGTDEALDKEHLSGAR